VRVICHYYHYQKEEEELMIMMMKKMMVMDGSDGVNLWTCPKSEFYPVIFKCHPIGESTRRQRLLISSRDGSITGSCKCEVRWKLFMKLEVFVVKASCPWLTPILKKLGKGPRSIDFHHVKVS